MKNFQTSEVSGRTRLVSWLQSQNCTNITPSFGEYNEVDMFATSAGGNGCVFEVKERRLFNLAGVRYPDVILSINKVCALMYASRNYNCPGAFYACFDVDSPTLYLFDIWKVNLSLRNKMNIRQTTCGWTAPVERDVYHLSFDDAYVYCETLANGWYCVRTPKYLENR